MPDSEVIQRVKLVVAQTKKVEREARYLKQMASGLSELLQLQEKAQGENNDSTSSTQGNKES